MSFKGFVVCMLMLCLTFAGTASACVAVNLNDSVLFSDDGEVLITPGVYDRLTVLGNTGLTAARSDTGKIRLLDEKGNPITGSVYTDVSVYGDYVILCTNGYYGVVDAKLNQVIPYEYSFITGRENGFLALKGDIWDDIADSVYLITENGESAVTGTRIMYPVYTLVNNGEAALSGANYRYGYIGDDGKWMIDAMFLAGGMLTDGMAVVTLATGKGVINTNGDWLITPFCDDIALSETAIVTLRGSEVAIYTRDSEGCTRIIALMGNAIAVAGRLACVYSEKSLIVFDTVMGTRYELEKDACVTVGAGGTFIVTEMTGESIRDSRGRTIGNTASALRILDSETYVCYEYDGEVSYVPYRCGAVNTKGEAVLENKYLQVTSPAEGYIAAEDAEYIYLFVKENGAAKLISSVPHSD